MNSLTAVLRLGYHFVTILQKSGHYLDGAESSRKETKKKSSRAEKGK